MNRGSRVWWLYRSVYAMVMATVCGGMVAALLWQWPSQKDSGWHWLVSLVAQVWAHGPAQRAGIAACLAAGVPQDGYIARWMEPVEPSDWPEHDPPSLAHRCRSPRNKRLRLWMISLVGVASAALSLVSWHQYNWTFLAVGAVCVLVSAVVAVFVWRDRAVLEVDGSGLRNVRTGRLVPWDSIEWGWMARERGVDGALQSEWLYLEDVTQRCVWWIRTEKLPPHVRADLFAWVRARANLREADADA